MVCHHVMTSLPGSLGRECLAQAWVRARTRDASRRVGGKTMVFFECRICKSLMQRLENRDRKCSLCWYNVVQPGCEEAIEKRVEQQHDETAGDGQTRHLDTRVV